jgi:hypothetical protein
VSHELNRRSPDERGNMIVAVAVIMVLAMLSAAVVARTLSGLHATRQGQDFSGALAHADAGVSDALFRVDQMGAAAASSFCVGPSPNCTVQSIPGSPGTIYTATRINATSYDVKSKGIVNGQPHAVDATIQQSYSYPYAIFTKTSLNFNGNTGNYVPASCSGPVETVDATGNVVCVPQADVATNGQITCHGSDSPAHQQDYYKGGGTNCQNGYLMSGTYNPQDPTLTCPAPKNVPKTPCLPNPHLPCPAVNGVIPLTLLPGDYYCSQLDLGGGKSPTISFQPGFTVGGATGAVNLYIIPTDGSNITVSIADTCGWNNAANACTTGINFNGDPTRLGVYLAGGTVDPGNGMTHSGNFTGIMYAPNAIEANPSCNATWRGAIVVNSFTCNGGTHLDVKYDSRLLNLVDISWIVTNYTEIPTNQVVLP